MTQPFLHELVTCVHAPVTVLGAADGQIRPDGAQGLHWLDRRRLSSLVLTIDGREPTAVGHSLVGGGDARFVAAVMAVETGIADPTVRVERVRTARADGMTERIDIVNDSRIDVVLTVEISATCDLAAMNAVKHGDAAPLVAPVLSGDHVRWTGTDASTSLRVHADTGTVSAGVDGTTAHFSTTLSIGARKRSGVDAVLTVSDDAAASWFTAVDHAPWAGTVGVTSASPSFDALVGRAAADVGSLLLADGPDLFAAAGSPWFLTMFGRDSIWAAQFMLPFGTELAAGTLRALARRQATTADAELSAEPGKMPHEVRLQPVAISDAVLPPLYYGTIDATPLWISLLHDAWRWGMPGADVADLLGHLERAVAWIVDARDGSGLLSYRDESGRGLANQGWKDSGDSVQDATGRLADPPITLCEVQGYAHRALLDAAALLDAFGRPGGDDARDVAGEVAAAFRRRFWAEGRDGRYPVIALDGHGQPVDSLTSNIVHLAGTGLLDADEEDVVAALAKGDRLSSGYGLRTLDVDHPQFNPLGYHSGSVWPHDTAIAVSALAAAGHGSVASRLARGLVDAAPTFEHRLPELFGGRPRADGPPLAYPAACRPQAWSAAAPVAILAAALGLSADAGGLTASPDPAFAWLFPLTVTGLRALGTAYDVEVDAGANATVTRRPGG